MPQTYITQSEEWILSHLPAGQFHAEDRQLYHDHISPRLIRELLKNYDYEEAIGLLDYVIERIDIRLDRAKDRRLRYELACYRSWLMNIRGQIEASHSPERAAERRISFMEALKRVIARQAHP
jgi:replicative superfamily II helicase